MTLRDDDYINITMDEDKSLYRTVWKRASSDIYDSEEIKSIINDICNKLEMCRPKYYIANQKDKEVAYPVDIQRWVAEKLYKASCAANVEYVATIESGNISVSMSNDQMIGEVEIKNGIKVATFNDESAALKWMNLEN
ncbi:MAG: hypothetical protein IKR94_04470 [Bacteroidales bacterium]|nr:hypothetical protein [Bacteroidales bacterium]